MRSTITNSHDSQLNSGNFEALVKDLASSASATWNAGEQDATIAGGIDLAKRIWANGLEICRHDDGRLRGGVITSLDLSPYAMGRHIDARMHKSYYVNSSYYGTENDQKSIPHGLTKDDLGKMFFLVEPVNKDLIPGWNKNTPSSFCRKMKWGDERDRVAKEFLERFSAAGICEAVNYLTHSFIYDADLNRSLFSDTLGVVGWIDYIGQPYNTSHDLCPYGCVRCGGEPRWNANSAGADVECVAAFLVR
ncbi:MAG: hypothetical protein LBM12_01675 [Candidatus Nomurabacteria bacterium]|jgi:hypothetical protein|nr:hypothetical protein [Candidatus Nomurabacteria bacterium]